MADETQVPPVVAEPLTTTATEQVAPVLDFIAKQRDGQGDESHPPADVVPPVVVPPAATEPKAGDDASWKKMPIADLLKEYGVVDDKLIKLVTHHQNKGDLSDYFKTFNTDFTAMPETDLLQMQINEAYADYTEEERADLYQTKLDSYKLDPDLYSEDEIRRAKVAIKADLKDFRAKKIAEQSEMLAKNPASEATQVGDAALTQQYIEALTKNPDYQNFEKTGVITVGPGEAAFNIDVDKAKVMAYLADDEAYQKTYLDNEGKVDFRKQLRVAAYAVDPDAYDAQLLSLAGKSKKIDLINSLGNEAPPPPQGSEPAEMTDAQKLALHIYNQQKG